MMTNNAVEIGAPVTLVGDEFVSLAATATTAGLQIVDWFHHTEKRNFNPEAEADREYRFFAPVGATLPQILEIGYKVAKLPRGSGRAGCYEIQCDAGIWSSPTRSRLNPTTATLEAW